MPAYTRLSVMMLLAAAFITSCKKNVDTVVKKESSPVSVAPIPPTGNYWSQLSVPVFPGPPSTNDHHASFSHNNKIYVGVNGPNQLWRYDPATNGPWTVWQNPFYNFYPSDYFDVFTNGDNVYFLNAATKKFKAYNIPNNQWADKADFPGTAKEFGAAANTTTKGYIMGGANGMHENTYYKVTLGENWEYDFAGNTWTQKANTPGFGRHLGAAHAIGDKIYFGTGFSVVPLVNPVTLQISWVPYMLSDWWEYNTLQNTWTQKASFTGGGRADTRGFVIGNRIYIGMGASEYYLYVQSDFYEYNSSSNSWVQRASYPPGESFPPFHSMLSANNRGYSVFGRLAAFWKYTPPTVFVPVN